MRKSAPLFCALLLSLSARRAWIEIMEEALWKSADKVALRKESVDRNRFFWFCLGTRVSSLSARRAWIEIKAGRIYPKREGSLSARRAWIEIIRGLCRSCAGCVALRKESVDRNAWDIQRGTAKAASLSARRAWIEMTCTPSARPMKRSLSARRAWIEIPYSGQSTVAQYVALRKESVDRNK